MKKLPPMMITTALLLGLAMSPALAQNQLDNNLEQRSGQINPQATNVDYGSRNDIVYGNINAGKGFRGNLNYGAPGDFRGNTGSDELYRYRANSTPSVTGTDLTKPQSVRRASHSALLGSIGANNTINRSAIPASGLPMDAYRTGQATTTGQLIRTPEFGASRAGTIGIQGDLSGQSLGIGATSSQSLGVPSNSPVGAMNLRPVGVGAYGSSKAAGTLYGALTTPQISGSSLGSGVAGTSDSLWKIDPTQNQAYPNSTAPSLEQVIAPMQMMPNNALRPVPAHQSMTSMEQKAAQLQAQQVKLEASLSSNVGEDTYMKLQHNQANRQRVAKGLDPVNYGADPNNQFVADPSQIKSLPSNYSLFNNLTGNSLDNDPSATGSLKPLPRGGQISPMPNASGIQSLLNPNNIAQSALPQLTPLQQTQVQQQLQDAMLQSRGVTDNNTILNEVVSMPVPSMTVKPEIQVQPTGGLFANPASNTASTAASPGSSTGYLLNNYEQTGISVQGIQLPHTRATQQREWHSIRSMSQATLSLKAGRYLDAERQFKSVLLGNPEEYEASAGLLCAQLGAGMVRSTVLNLRQHMTKFPEQIAYKLDRAYLPSGKRLNWVRKQAENLMQQYGNYDAALLLAFLGYQTSDKQLLQYGLGLAQKYLAGDQLVADLSRSWLGQ
ncbi:MAG: hypothetical protein JKX85_04985 [Phycisphaeraceae bacterium]|nr:hypothetical protein [Phycisphaeraceae bacterium]